MAAGDPEGEGVACDYGCTVSSSLLFRLVRTTAFAVVCLGLGMVAHVFAGGSVPGPAMVAGFGLAGACAYPLAGRERGPRTILALLSGLQAALHAMFSVAEAGSPVATLAHPAHASAGLAADLGMLVTHGWAVVLTTLWLSRGEAALWGLLRRLAVRLVAVLLPPAPATPFLSLPYAEPPVLRPALLRDAVIGRGPPVVVGDR